MHMLDWRRQPHDPYRKTLQTAARSLLVNLLYALYNGALGLLSRSTWFLTMFAYYTILSVMRFATVMCAYRHPYKTDPSTAPLIAKLCGVLLMLMSLVLAAVVYLSLTERIATRYGTIIMITIATYTFYKITMAVIRAVRHRRNPSAMFAALRCIGYTEVAVSVLTLQRSMLVSFGETDTAAVYTLNLCTGIAVCLFVFILGVTLIGKKPHFT